MKYPEDRDLLLGAVREAKAQSSYGQGGFALLPGEGGHTRPGRGEGILGSCTCSGVRGQLWSGLLLHARPRATLSCPHTEDNRIPTSGSLLFYGKGNNRSHLSSVSKSQSR